MKKIISGIYVFLLCIISVKAQVKIGDNPNTINANSLLELESTNKGFLPPRIALNSLISVTPLTGTVPTGMIIYSSGGTLKDGYYYWNGTKWQRIPQQRDNYVLVKSASDFPAPVAGVITLSAGILYEINGTITLTDMIDLNGCYLIGQDLKNDILLYTPTTGALFTGANTGSLSNLTLSATGVGAKLFNIDAGGVVTKSLFLNFVSIQNCNNIGLIKGIGGVVIFADVIFINNTNGITLQDIGDYAGRGVIWTPTNRNTFQTFTGTFGTIMMLGGEIQTLAAFSATGLNISGITSITNAASLKSTMFVGNGTYVTGSFNNKWEVETYGLPTEKDDVAAGNCYLTTTATTVIASANVPVKMLGTTTSVNLFRMTSPVNNRLTYTGQKNRRCEVFCSMTTTFTGGGSNKFFSFYIAKNGVVLPESKQRVKLINNTDQSAISISCLIFLLPNDYIEVWVENNTDGTDMIIQNLNLSIK